MTDRETVASAASNISPKSEPNELSVSERAGGSRTSNGGNPPRDDSRNTGKYGTVTSKGTVAPYDRVNKLSAMVPAASSTPTAEWVKSIRIALSYGMEIANSSAHTAESN